MPQDTGASLAPEEPLGEPPVEQRPADGFVSWLQEGGVQDPLRAPLPEQGFFAQMAVAPPKGLPEVLGEAVRNPLSKAPWVGPLFDYRALARIRSLAESMQAGTATTEEQQEVLDWIRDQQRDTTTWGLVGSILTELPGFVTEFAAGGAIAGRLGASAAGKAVGESIERGLEQLARGAVAGAATRAARTFAKSAVQTAAMPTRVLAETMRRALPDMQLEEDAWGDLALVFKGTTPEFVDALPAGVIDTWIEAFSEATGGALSAIPPLPALHLAQGKLLERFVPPGQMKQTLERIAQAGGWNGMIEEWGEERVGAAMRAMILDEPWEDVIPDMKQGVAEAVAFAIPGAASTAAQLAAGGRADEGAGAPPAAGEAPTAEAPPAPATEATESPPGAEQAPAPMESGAQPEAEPAPPGPGSLYEPAPGAWDSPGATPEPVEGEPPALRRFLDGNAAAGADVSQAALVEPNTPELQAEADLVRSSGREYLLVDAGQPLPRPGMVDPETGALVFDARMPSAERRRQVVFHELTHVLQEVTGRQAAQLWQAIEGVDPEGAQAAVEEYARRQRARGLAALDPEASIQEGMALYFENVAGYLDLALRDRGRVAALAKGDRTLLEAVLDVLARLLRRLGVDAQGPSLRRLEELRAEVAQTPQEKALPPRLASQIALAWASSFDAVVGRAAAAQASPAQVHVPEQEGATESALKTSGSGVQAASPGAEVYGEQPTEAREGSRYEGEDPGALISGAREELVGRAGAVRRLREELDAADTEKRAKKVRAAITEQEELMAGMIAELADAVGTPAAGRLAAEIQDELARPAGAVAQMPTEAGLFGQQERPERARAEAAGPTVTQPNLLDIQEGDLPGQSSLLDVTETGVSDARAVRFADALDRVLGRTADTPDFGAAAKPITKAKESQLRDALEKAGVEVPKDVGERLWKLRQFAYGLHDQGRAARAKQTAKRKERDAEKRADREREDARRRRSEASRRRLAERKARIMSGDEGNLRTFIAAAGGLNYTAEAWERFSRKEAGERMPIGIGRVVHPTGSGLGTPWDIMAQLAGEAGYFQGRDPRELDFNEFLDAMDSDTRPQDADEQALDMEREYQERQEAADAWYRAQAQEKGLDPDDPPFALEPVGPELVALHSLSEENLLHADELGGLAMPSLGITRSTTPPFTGFGDITLIAPKLVVDPERGTPVYESDAWTPRHPRMQYRNRGAKTAQAIVDELRASLEATGQHPWYLFDALTEKDKTRAIETFETRGSPFRQVYLHSIGRPVRRFTRKTPLQTAGADSKAFREWVKSHPDVSIWDLSMQSPEWVSLSAALRKGLEEQYAGHEPLNDWKHWGQHFNEDGVLFFGKGGRLVEDVKAIRGTGIEIDTGRIEDLARRKANEHEYRAWYFGLLNRMYFDPYIRVGRKRMPYTLYNVVDAMRTERPQGKEEALAFGAGKARAVSAKKFRTLDEIRAAAEKIDSGDALQAYVRDVQEPAMHAFHDAILEKSEYGTWDALDSSMKAIGEVLRRKTRTVAHMRQALRRNYFRGPISDADAQLGLALAEAIDAAPTEYFEAKPQRAVAIAEFVGAAVPKERTKALEVLRRNGVPVETFSGEGGREKALKKLYRTQPEARFALEPATNVPHQDDGRRWFSAVEVAVADLAQERMTPEQLAAALRKAPGVTEEELEWLQVGSLLEGRESVTKTEALEWVREHRVEVREEVLGALDQAGRWEPFKGGLRRKIGNRWTHIWVHSDGEVYGQHPGGLMIRFDSVEEAQEFFDEDGKSASSRPTRHATHVLPGGENYRELLLTLPETGALPEDGRRELLRNGRWRVDFSGGTFASFSTEEEAISAQQDAAVALRTRRDGSFTDSHFDTPNILAHIRFNERTDADGNLVLFIEEIQSDWHQQGRKKGYAPSLPLTELPSTWEVVELGAGDAPYYGVRRAGSDEPPLRTAPTRGEAIADTLAAMNAGAIGRASLGVPDAPFKTSWHTLALKRAIKWAADHGFDSVAWTTGRQQVDRYESQTRQVVDHIEWRPHRSGQTHISTMKGGAAGYATFADARGVVSQGEFAGRTIEDVFGKDIAARILAEPEGEISGEEITVGGKGMETFYDRMLVSAANKLGKRYGVKAGRTNLEQYPSPKARGHVDPDLVPVHTLPIPPAMREVIRSAGFSTFAPKFSLTPEENLYEDESRMEAVARAAGQALKEGESTDVGSKPSRIAGTTKDPEERAVQRGIREVRSTSEDADGVARATNRAKAEAELERDRAGTRAAILEKVGRGETLNAWETEAASILKADAAMGVLESGSVEQLAEATFLGWAYQNARRDVARALGQIRDALHNPNATAREKLADLLTTMSRDIRRKIERWRKELEDPRTTPGRRAQVDAKIRKLLAIEATRIRKARRALVRAGFAPNLITQEYFTDEVAYARIARIVSAAKASKWDWYIEYTIAAMTSGPLTHKANLVGNVGHAIWEQHMKRLAQVVVNLVVQDPNSASVGELVEFYRAFIPAWMQAAHNFVRAYKTEIPVYEADLSRKGVPTGKWGMKLDALHGPAIPGLAGRAIRAPSLTTLLAVDELIKTVTGISEAHALAYRAARAEGKKGQELYERQQEILQDPRHPIHVQALITTKKVAFQLPAGPITSLVMQARAVGDDLGPFGIPLGTTVLPFIKTPAGIFGAGLDAVLSAPRFMVRLASGRYRKNQTELVTDAGSALVGSAVTFAVLYAVFATDDDGLPLITGSAPPNPQMRALGYRTAPPYSVRLFGQYWSYQRVEPAAVTWATLVDLGRIAQQAILRGDDDAAAEAIAALGRSVADQMSDKTFLRSVGDLYETIFSPYSSEKKALALARDMLITKHVPNIIKQPLRETDPFIRQNALRQHDDESIWASGARNTLYQSFPVARFAPPMRFDIWGRPITRFSPETPPLGRLAIELVSPFPKKSSVEEVHDLDRLILRYNSRVHRGEIPEAQPFYGRPPDYWYREDGTTHYWSDDEYAELQRESGQIAVQRLMGTRLNFEEPGERDIERIKDALSTARKRVRARLQRARNSSP